jgi:hypothetical protein
MITLRFTQRSLAEQNRWNYSSYAIFERWPNVTRAAETLFVSQSAISRAVTQLEEELDVPPTSMREAAALPPSAITAWEGLVDRAAIHEGQKHQQVFLGRLSGFCRFWYLRIN